MIRTKKRPDGVAVRHDAASKDGWHIGCIVGCKAAKHQDVSAREYLSILIVQEVVVQYRIEWWENFALPNDKEVLSTYGQSWEDSSILDDLPEEYAIF